MTSTMDTSAVAAAPSSSNGPSREERRRRPRRRGQAPKRNDAAPTSSISATAPVFVPSSSQTKATPENATPAKGPSTTNKKKTKKQPAKSDKHDKPTQAATASSPHVNKTSVPPKSRRATKGRGFGAKLSDPTVSQTSVSSHALTTTTIPDYSDLRTRLISELSNDEYDCIICYNTVMRKQPVWSCSRCHAVLHLSCVRTWAEKSVAQMEEKNRMHEDPEIRNARGHWRCPGCQHVREAIPRTYTCWCGRVKQPKPHSIPHSCGGQCRRGCTWHGCAATVCHPGPCPPCAATVMIACFCGKDMHKSMRCSQLRDVLDPSLLDAPLDTLATKGVVSCGQVCGKPLACGLHTCTQSCHAGACEPCSISLPEAPCHCGRHTRAMVCGNRSAEAYGLASAWSCGEPCDAPFACGFHHCTKPCHVRTGVAPCPFDPAHVKTCPCGRMRVTDRADCRAPIPTCGARCSKVLQCGHTCTSTCHLGACPPCTEPVVQVCRCGTSKRHVPCDEAATPFECDVVCKASRHCGKHQCGRRCCPLAYMAALGKKALPADTSELDPMQFHACPLPCNKLLSCGRHHCERSCHRGPCAPCLRSSFTEVACPCGRTVLEPPVPCGTQVICSYPCARPPPPCGHPKVPHACHPLDVPCPPCVYLTNKVCVCGRTTLSAVPCSRQSPRCGVPCEQTLACGQHTCTGTCHAPGECPPCTQPCGRPREVCGHPCEKPCHAPAPCDETEPCHAVVHRRCACGHREKIEVCGASMGTDSKRSATEPLACTPACKIAQRNARFASALGLDSKLTQATSASVTYAPSLVQYVGEDTRGAKAVQDVLNDFVQSPRAAAQLRAMLTSYSLRRGCEPVRVHGALLTFAEQLATAYQLDVEKCTPEGLQRIGPTPPNGRDADIRVRRTRTTRLPAVLLTDYVLTAPTRASVPPSTAPKPAASTAAMPRANALVLEMLPASLRDEPAVLQTALAPCLQNGRRSWHIQPSSAWVLLTQIQLEPLSLAAIASRPIPSGTERFLPMERRLVWLAQDVQAALMAAGASTTTVRLGHVEAGQLTSMWHDGRWSTPRPPPTPTNMPTNSNDHDLATTTSSALHL